MKKVCVIVPSNIYLAPYYYVYEDMLTSLNIDFDVIIWNRDEIDESIKGNIISLNLKDVANSGNKTKILKYIKFAKFVKRNLESTKYEKAIFLGTNGGVVPLLSKYLEKNLKGKYWLDIRDYTFEWFKPYKNAIYRAVLNSNVCTISSPGYKEFLPSYDYIQTHNIDLKSIAAFKKRPSKKKQLPIKISFIGNVRYFNENVKLINILGNDNRFRLQYYGAQSEKLKEYCNKNLITNVEFHGRFLPNETHKFYEKTDIINNVYGNSGIELTTALSNKLYYAAGMHIPILVSRNTYMEKISREFGFGFTMDYSDNDISNKLHDWFLSLNDITCRYDEFMSRVLQEYNIFLKKLESYLIE